MILIVVIVLVFSHSIPPGGSPAARKFGLRDFPFPKQPTNPRGNVQIRVKQCIVGNIDEMVSELSVLIAKISRVRDVICTNPRARRELLPGGRMSGRNRDSLAMSALTRFGSRGSLPPRTSFQYLVQPRIRESNSLPRPKPKLLAVGGPDRDEKCLLAISAISGG